ncbi:unnamed protein product [Parascedosporium putredinis]|uniref:Amine oxidase domain-containing protein n=1 Tax=Parascedosporium putredinis TaxID=1442378 RepID=A0A9P1HE95_9PEZI|nr:unnamed protein product [Parascedosporium putredinis]CAI8005005.1 unnamed protein product [Parascedosporium putredinis]
MSLRMASGLSLLFAAGNTAANPTSTRPNHVAFQVPSDLSRGLVHNIHINYDDDKVAQGLINIVYGDCDATSASADQYHIASIAAGEKGHLPDRLRETLNETLGDTLGLWFDGVRHLQSNNGTTVFSKEAKSKSIGIVGGGISGLMTSLLLDSVGVHNWHIHEATQRIGGRIRTAYFDDSKPSDYRYQEMGPMRFPRFIQYADTNETLEIQDHKMVFQLIDVLNEMNADRPDLKIDLIKWIQTNDRIAGMSNGGRLPDGRIPSAAELAADPSLLLPAAEANDPEEAAEGRAALKSFINSTPESTRSVAANIYKAHRDAVDRGLLHWSESTYLRYQLSLSSDTVDFLTGWVTLDKGLDSLSRAFVPHVEGKITYGREISGLKYDEATSKISVTWRDDKLKLKPQSEAYDYAIVSVPFSVARLWKLPPYSSLLTRAIKTLNYMQACKMALEYETRFWEHLETPIFGGCGVVDITGINAVCYPSYNLNGTGPGVVLASYQAGQLARSLAALSDEDHVAMAQRSMAEIHGEIANEQFTGNYDRMCWEVEKYQAGAWAAPTIGQQDLFIPSYYNTEFNTIFIGEHTSITHAWIFSALDSAVRGTTQLLLDLGLVDEAKEVVQTWMARWITV